MVCNVEDCQETATLRYTWAWGEEGACCDAHRAKLETLSAQLNRSIAFTQADETTLREYKTPTLERISPELGQLRMRVAELTTELQSKDAEIILLKEELARIGGQQRAASVAVAPSAPDVEVTERPRRR